MLKINEPKIDQKKMEEAANRAAEKAFIEEIERHYTNYDSPYRIAVREELKKQKVPRLGGIPQIMSEINKALSAEMDIIDNNAVSVSFINDFRSILDVYNKEEKLSTILADIISNTHANIDDIENFDFSAEKDENFKWLSCKLKIEDKEYLFTLHHHDEDKYKLLSFPGHFKGGYNKKITIETNGSTVELPYSMDILKDPVLNILAKLFISGTMLEVDCDNFEDDMFPESDTC